VKNIGKPCAGKPHARFDEGGQGETCSLLYPRKFIQAAGFYPPAPDDPNPVINNEDLAQPVTAGNLWKNNEIKRIFRRFLLFRGGS
jgi:hypothetical protein